MTLQLNKNVKAQSTVEEVIRREDLRNMNLLTSKKRSQILNNLLRSRKHASLTRFGSSVFAAVTSNLSATEKTATNIRKDLAHETRVHRARSGETSSRLSIEQATLEQFQVPQERSGIVNRSEISDTLCDDKSICRDGRSSYSSSLISLTLSEVDEIRGIDMPQIQQSPFGNAAQSEVNQDRPGATGKGGNFEALILKVISEAKERKEKFNSTSTHRNHQHVKEIQEQLQKLKTKYGRNYFDF